MRIVVVEDGVKIRRGIIHLIQKINPKYQVVGEASNGVDGMKTIAGLKPDLVIADIRMPELNGLEMLQGLKEQGLKHKTIILSAYSDFSFAQQAIGIGVSEYLLKPLTAEKLQKSLAAIELELMNEDKKSQSSRIITVRYLLQDLMLGRVGNIKELRQYLNADSGFDGTQPFALVAAYTGNKIYDREALQQVLSKILSENPEVRYFIIDVEINGLTLLLVSCQSGFSGIEVLLTSGMLETVHRHDFPNLVMGWVAVGFLEELHSKLQQLSEILKWALLLGKDIMITQSNIAGLDIRPLEYPSELEKQAVAEVSRHHFQNLGEIFKDFLAWWTEEKYPPEQIVASFVRFISSITNAVKETDLDLFKQLKQQEILQQSLGGITMDQLEASLNELLKRLCQMEYDQKTNYSLSVIKALKVIVANYQIGITREELATRLHITPEYLSMLFYKEVGQSFTAYLKNYRINKAKELLIESDLKIYEIAEKVGYPDPKYFCRVFKEITGVPASEYQKYLLEHGG